MNVSKIIDAVISENLLDAKSCLNSLLYSRTEQALEEKTIELVDETFNEGCTDCNEAGEGDKEAYKKFYKSALKKFGVTEPGQLEGDKKKEFYNYIDKNWKSDAEEDGVEEATDVDIAKEKEKIAVSQERIKGLNDRQKREKQRD